MSELPPSALPMKPQDGVHQSMCLQLHNNNNFLKSSSASSASSASSSPDSTYSLSSLDVELPEGMMGRKAAASEDDSGIQSPDCRPDENDNSVSVYLDANEEEYDNTIIQNHENDNVFSDAGVDGERGRRGSVDSSATEAQLLSSEDEDEEDDSFLSLRSSDVVMSKRSESEEVQMCSSNHSPTVGLVSELYQEAFQDSVDLPNEEGQMCSSTMMPSVGLVSELHQEASQVFYNEESKMQRSTNWTEVDLGSELHQKAHQEPVELHKKEEQMQCSDRSLNVGSVSLEVLQESVELQDEEIQIQTSAQRPNVDLVTETHQETVQATVDLSAEKSPAQPPAELVLNQTMLPSVSQGAPSSSSIQNIKDPPCFPKRNTSQNTNDPSDISHTTSAMEPPKTKSTKMELKRFSRPNLKDVKPKVISRATSAPRPVNTDQSCEKNPLITRSRAANRREQGDDGVKKNRGSATQARATMSTTISDSDSKSTWPLMVKKQPPEFPGSKVVTNDCHVQTSSKVTETVRDERGNHHSEVEVDETPRDGDVDQTVSSDLRPPGVIARVQSRGGVSAGVRAATLAGVPKMRVIDSNPSTCGSAPSWKPPLKSASSKLPIKSGGLPMNLSSSSVGGASENKGAVQVMKNEEVCVRPSSSSQGKSACTKPAAGVRNRANTPAKPNTAGQKVIQSKTTQSALQRGGAVRPSRNSATVCPSSRGPRGTRPVHTHTEEEEEKKNRSILQLRSLVTHGNRKLEALAVVIQHIFNEREEALKQKKEISIQLKNLREELAQSVVCCERLECEKESVCAQLDAAVLALQQQHQVELTQLEDRLRDFYSAEWDKAHQVYQDEADRCTALMRQQVEEVKSKQEALRTEQEVAHSQQIEELRQGYEAMLAELYKGHERDRQELDNTLKRSEAALNERIVSLTEENETLSERLRETEEKRKALADKSQRDSRVVYLEQELDSLKVVLDIKTNQLHQQDKKLMQMDKLIETNVKLEEFVTKLKQENEDYKARMDKHAELSRQLSTEQAMLQQTLQKESKTNKRLSMENEELLWKLHNGLSPRNSASFPSSPVSPR